MLLHIQKPETVNSLLLKPVVLVMLFIYGCCGETSAGLTFSYHCFNLIEDHRRPSPEPTPLQHPGYAFLQQLHQQEAIAEKLCQVLWENLLKVLSMLCLTMALLIIKLIWMLLLYILLICNQYGCFQLL